MIRVALDTDGEGQILRSADERIGLTLPTTGSGSYVELVEYVRTVLEQNTDLKPEYNPTGSFDKLARGMMYSILHRLEIGWIRPEETE